MKVSSDGRRQGACWMELTYERKRGIIAAYDDII